MEKAEAQSDTAKVAVTTNVHIYELEKAEASRTLPGWWRRPTSIISPGEATEDDNQPLGHVDRSVANVPILPGVADKGGEVPQRGAERLAELIAAADAAVELADQARMAAYEGTSAGRRGGGAAARRARKAKAAYEQGLAAAQRAVRSLQAAQKL